MSSNTGMPEKTVENAVCFMVYRDIGQHQEPRCHSLWLSPWPAITPLWALGSGEQPSSVTITGVIVIVHS